MYILYIYMYAQLKEKNQRSNEKSMRKNKFRFLLI